MILDLSADLLRLTTHWLKPRDRFNLALTCKRMYQETWGTFAEEDLTSRFAFESRFEFPLDVRFRPSRFSSEGNQSPAFAVPYSAVDEKRASLRLVPERSRMQHCYVSVNSTGNLVAILTYDNVLRIVKPRTQEVIASIDVGSICGMDLWCLESGRRASHEGISSPSHEYEEENGVDLEIGFGFTPDDRRVYISSKSKLTLYEVDEENQSLRPAHSLDVRKACEMIEQDSCVGGSCSISPDGETAAWIIFADCPALAYATIWSISSEKCLKVCKVATIHPRRWSALGWARLQFSPSGNHLISIVNNAKKALRIVTVGEVVERVKMSEFVFSAFDMKSMMRSSVEEESFQPCRSKRAWIHLNQEVFPTQVASFLSTLVDGLEPPITERRSLTSVQEMRLPSFHINGLHSCPSEATYKALSFGPQTRHPWFVTKLPMCSVRLGLDGKRAMTSSANYVSRLVSGASDALPGRSLVASDGQQKRAPYAFKGMPWKAGYASASAFSSSGKWLVGITLIGDSCVVCVRNITLEDFYGQQAALS